MNTTQQRRRLTEKDWEPYKTVIRDLFLKDRLSLRVVKAELEKNHQFTVDERQWKHRIKKWKLDRNIKDCEMRAMVKMRQHWNINQPHLPELKFKVREFDVNPRKIRRWMKDHNVPDDQPYTEYLALDTPSDITCYTETQQGSSTVIIDIEMTEAGLVPRASSPPESEPSHVRVVSNIPEPVSQTDAVSKASGSSDSRSWIETTDVSWAFDTPWTELRAGHESDTDGHPLSALVRALETSALEQNITIPTGTLATMLCGDGTSSELAYFTQHGSSRDGDLQETDWDVQIERKVLSESKLLVWVYANPQGHKWSTQWLVLRLRIGSGTKYYREGHARLHAVHGPCDSVALFHAISDDDIQKVKRILAAEESAVFFPSWDRYYRCPISLAAFEGNTRIARLLLESGSPVTSTFRRTENIIWDTWEGFSNRWRYDKGRISFKDDFERCKTLTQLASDYGAHIDECVDQELDIYGIPGNLLFSLNLANTLDFYQFQQVFQYLLHAGVDIEYRNDAGWTPLLHALGCYGLNPFAVQAYLDAKVDITVTDNKGRGYMHFLFDTILSPWQKHERLQSCRETLVILFREDLRYKEQPITSSNTPLIEKLVHKKSYWDTWKAVFQDLGWDFTEMEQYVMSLQPPPAWFRPSPIIPPPSTPPDLLLPPLPNSYQPFTSSQPGYSWPIGETNPFNDNSAGETSGQHTHL